MGAISDGLVVDLFAGGGGASDGIVRGLGRPVDIAINHSPEAVSMHAANHPGTRHYCENIRDVDPREAVGSRWVKLLWASPDCTQFSKAKGGKPRDKGIRCLAHVVIRWARAVKPQTILLENVEEFRQWGPIGDDGLPDKTRLGEDFRAWLAALVDCGYDVDFRELVAAHYGAPTTRKRLYLVAQRRGSGAIVWPSASHGKALAKPWRTAAEVIDWSIPCPSIFDRARPLADATLRRIAAGVHRYVIGAAQPFIVPVKTWGGGGNTGRGTDEPLRTVTASKRGEFALVSPTLIQTGYGERDGQAPRVPGLHKPLGTVVADQKHAVVAAFLAKHYGGVVGHGVERPIGTLTSQDHHSLTTADLAPVGSARAADVRAFLVKFYGSSGRVETQHQSAITPLHVITAKARFGLVVVDGEAYEIADIGMRMLQPRELFNAQGFDPGYRIDIEHNGKPLTKTAQIALCGNSVCPPVAEALVRANGLTRGSA